MSDGPCNLPLLASPSGSERIPPDWIVGNPGRRPQMNSADLPGDLRGAALARRALTVT